MELFTALAMCYALTNTQEYLDNNCYETLSGYHQQLKSIELTDEQIEAIARVTYAEAANQNSIGITAVTFVILNRLLSHQFGNTIDEVVNAKNQFEPVTKAKGWKNLPSPPDSHQKEVKTILNLIQSGELKDPTKGSLYFQNPVIVASREGKGRVSKGLTRFGNSKAAAIIHDHEFYQAINSQPTKGATPSWDIYKQSKEKQSWLIF